MRQLMMIHLLDEIPVRPAPEGFFIRNWKPGEEEDWVAICKYGLLGPDATINEWNSAILGQGHLDPAADGRHAGERHDLRGSLVILRGVLSRAFACGAEAGHVLRTAGKHLAALSAGDRERGSLAWVVSFHVS